MKSCSIKVFSSLVGIMIFSLYGMNDFVEIKITGLINKFQIEQCNVRFSLHDQANEIILQIPSNLESHIVLKKIGDKIGLEGLSESAKSKEIEIKTHTIYDLAILDSLVRSRDKFYMNDKQEVRICITDSTVDVPQLKGSWLYLSCGESSKVNFDKLLFAGLRMIAHPNAKIARKTIKAYGCKISSFYSSEININKIYYGNINKTKKNKKPKMLILLANKKDINSMLFFLPKELIFYIFQFVKPRQIDWIGSKVGKQIQIPFQKLSPISYRLVHLIAYHKKSRIEVNNIVFPGLKAESKAPCYIDAGLIDTFLCTTEGNIQAQGSTHHLTVIGATEVPSTLQLETKNPVLFEN